MKLNINLLLVCVSLIAISLIASFSIKEFSLQKAKIESLGIQKTIEPYPATTPISSPIALPTQAPTKNSSNDYLTSRVKEIDLQIKQLEADKISAKEARDKAVNELASGDSPKGYDPLNTMILIKQVDARYQDKIKTIQEQINTLNAEKTQIMLKL